MFERTYYATHPDMMECVSNEELRDRYLIQGLFREGECVLNYTHADRFVIGGVVVGGAPVRAARPEPSRPPPRAIRSSSGASWRPSMSARRTGTVTVDGEAFALGNKDCLYVTMGAKEVTFSGAGARFYLASCPAHKAFATRKLSIAEANALERGSLEESNQRTIYQLVIPGVCDSAQLVMGLTVLEPGSVWNTMPPHIHERRSEIYFYFDLPQAERPGLPLHGRRRGDAAYRGRQRGGGDLAALVDPHGLGHQGLCLHLGDGGRESRLYRHERARHLPAANEGEPVRPHRQGRARSPAPTPGSARRSRWRWPRRARTSRWPGARRRRDRSTMVRAAGRKARADRGRPVAAPRRPHGMVEAMLEQLGRLDILVNNAGIIRRADARRFLRGRLGRGDRHQFEGAVLPLPGGGAAHDSRRGSGQDRQHRLDAELPGRHPGRRPTPRRRARWRG